MRAAYTFSFFSKTKLRVCMSTCEYKCQKGDPPQKMYSYCCSTLQYTTVQTVVKVIRRRIGVSTASHGVKCTHNRNLDSESILLVYVCIISYVGRAHDEEQLKLQIIRTNNTQYMVTKTKYWAYNIRDVT